MGIAAYYKAEIKDFLLETADSIIGKLAQANTHSLEEPQRFAWLQQISILKEALAEITQGTVLFEMTIPRMGKRVDAALVFDKVIILIEFKVGETSFSRGAVEQIYDYALDMKNFHEGSHNVAIVPVLVATSAERMDPIHLNVAEDLVAKPLLITCAYLKESIKQIATVESFPDIEVEAWLKGGYRPTPTIIEAAKVLYETHSVQDISRNDADAINLQTTSHKISEIIDASREHGKKSICFVTGVPGSGKTLAGLNIATRRSQEHTEEHAVFLSGNGPLVNVLREALARDKRVRKAVSLKEARREVSAFIQNIHHFRDEYVGNDRVPVEKVVVFDEAQRAWTQAQASYFMQRKRGQANFNMSEPEFLISVMDRHDDWCTIVCLIGGGQEINTGEAGISEWMNALESHFPEWDVYVSPRIISPEYGTKSDVEKFLTSSRVKQADELHLSISMRSFRAEALSQFIGYVLDGNILEATESYSKIRDKYPIVLTRSLLATRQWLRGKARGTERMGLIASSGALRLRAEGIHIKAEIQPENWFLNPRDDVRASDYLEDVATEFSVQGLELDWVGVCWDADFFFAHDAWQFQSFKGTKWQKMKDSSKRLYLKNTYRVILTRARQGMAIYIPSVDGTDATRLREFYEGTFDLLRSCGIPLFDGDLAQ